MVLENRRDTTREQAETLAIGALGFLAGEPGALGNFLRLSGIDPANLRAAAAEPGFLAGLLDYFLANEPLLVDYSRQAGIAPGEIGRARAALDA